MKDLWYALLTAAIVLLGSTCGSLAQSAATTVGSCGAATYPAGQQFPLQQTQTGNLCTNSSGGGGSSNATIVGPLGTQTSSNGVTVTIASDQVAVATKGVGVTTTDKAGTLTSGGTAQTAIALNTSRKGWCIQNPVSATEDLFVRVNGTASATTGVDLSPGFQACNLPSLIDTAAVSVFAATTSHTWLGFEVQ